MKSFVVLIAVVLLVAGCGTASYEAGSYDASGMRSVDVDEGQPATLFEMEFGGGETEVTKNLPGDAAERIGEAIKSAVPAKSPPEVVGE